MLSRSVVSNSVSPWTAAHQVPLSVGFSRQEYWNGLPFPSPGDLPQPGIEPGSPALQVDFLPSKPPGKSISILFYYYYLFIYLFIFNLLVFYFFNFKIFNSYMRSQT